MSTLIMPEERRETRKQGDVSDRQKRSESEEAQAAAVVATAMGGSEYRRFGGLLCYAS